MKAQSNYTHPSIAYSASNPFEFSPIAGLFNKAQHFGFDIAKPNIQFQRNLGRDYHSLLTREAKAEMRAGNIPNLEHICKALYDTFFQSITSASALQFVPVLQKLIDLDSVEVARFIQNPQTNHVLVKNQLLKVILIHWEPGKTSSIHGHAKGGCVFKVLHGKLEEKRYMDGADHTPQLVASSTFQNGSMAYIDDRMGYHSVGNPFDTPAISLHVYTQD